MIDTHYRVPFRCGVCLFVGLKIKVHLRMLHGVVAVSFRNTLLLKPEIIWMKLQLCRGSFSKCYCDHFRILSVFKFVFLESEPLVKCSVINIGLETHFRICWEHIWCYTLWVQNVFRQMYVNQWNVSSVNCLKHYFVKYYNRYGVGYHLTLVKNEGCNQNAVTSLIVSHVPNAQLLSSVGAEMEFLLSGEHSSGFERLFQEIEGKDFLVKIPFTSTFSK